MVIMEYNKNMEFLLPHKLSDFVDPGDNCLFVERIVVAMKDTPVYRKNLRKFRKVHKFSAGQKKYSMEMMLTVIIGGAIDGVFQARKLAKALKR